MEILLEFLSTTAVANMSGGNLLMIFIGAIFISLAIRKDYEPLLLLPIGFGCIVGNLPSISSMAIGVCTTKAVCSTTSTLASVKGSSRR